MRPEVGKLIEEMAELEGAILSRMSGSGATCFALFDSDIAAEKARDEMLKRYPNFWCVKTSLGNQFRAD